MEAAQIANRFREVIFNGTFIANTNYKDQLTPIDFNTAITQIDSLNTIALLVQHIHYYVNGINQVLKGGTLDIRDKYSFDFPPLHSQQDWKNFLTRFWNDADEFADLVENMPDALLMQPFVNEKYGSYERNIEAMIEHCYYHLGQIVFIKKMVLNNHGK